MQIICEHTTGDSQVIAILRDTIVVSYSQWHIIDNVYCDGGRSRLTVTVGYAQGKDITFNAGAICRGAGQCVLVVGDSS